MHGRLLSSNAADRVKGHSADSRARRHSSNARYLSQHSEQHCTARVQCFAVGLDFAQYVVTLERQYGTDISHKHSKQLTVLPRVGLDSK